MLVLQAVFLGMFAYGVWAGIYGAAMLSLLMLLFNCWAQRHMAAADRAWATLPGNASTPAHTDDRLAAHECESCRSRF